MPRHPVVRQTGCVVEGGPWVEKEQFSPNQLGPVFTRGRARPRPPISKTRAEASRPRETAQALARSADKGVSVAFQRFAEVRGATLVEQGVHVWTTRSRRVVRRVVAPACVIAALAAVLPFATTADSGSFASPLVAAPDSTPVVGVAATHGGGVWLAHADGEAVPYKGAPTLQSSPLTLSRPIVGIAAEGPASGYWLVAADGGIFSFGDAAFYGSTGTFQLNKAVVGMASTPDGHGYWLVAADGGIFSFGDAAFYGSTGNLALNKPVVGLASTPDGHGYWLVAADGGIFSFGDAAFYGSTGNLVLNKPVVGMASKPDGDGYWLVAADGGIFSFGEARFDGASTSSSDDVSGMADLANGYVVASDTGPVFFSSPAVQVPVQSPNQTLRSTNTTTTTTTTPATNGWPTGFQGAYEYAGNNSSTDATNPDLVGVDLDYYWSQIEPAKGQYDWSVITNAMAPWVIAGKKVILRIATAGQSSWDPPYSGSGTPSWVYSDGATSVTDSGEVVPSTGTPTTLAI